MPSSFILASLFVSFDLSSLVSLCLLFSLTISVEVSVDLSEYFEQAAKVRIAHRANKVFCKIFVFIKPPLFLLFIPDYEKYQQLNCMSKERLQLQIITRQLMTGIV